MAGINKVILIGHVGSTEKKERVTKLSLATSESYKDKNTGEKVEQTSWHRLVFFGKLAEIANQYVGKGDKLYIEGTIKYGKYTDQTGIERYTTDIIVRNMQMLTSKKDKQSTGGHQGNRPLATPGNPPHPAVDQNNYATNSDFDDDDIPF